MSTLTTPAFWAATAERAVRTAAQVAVATIGTTALIEQVDWLLVASTAGLSAVLTVLTAVGVDAATGTGPSITSAESLDYVPTHRADV